MRACVRACSDTVRMDALRASRAQLAPGTVGAPEVNIVLRVLFLLLHTQTSVSSVWGEVTAELAY